MISPVLNVRDVESSVAFYTRMLGFCGDGGLPGVDGATVFAEVMLDDMQVMFVRGDSAGAAGVELYIRLPERMDIRALYKRAKGQGVKIAREISPEFWGERVFSVFDPDGYKLTFAQKVRHARRAPTARNPSNVPASAAGD